MNDDVVRQYKEYLGLTGGDKAAAASLAVAHLLLSIGRNQSVTGQPLTVPEVAKFLRVRPEKVLSWIRSGRLRGYNVAEKETGRPKYRINPEDLEAFMMIRMPLQPVPRGRPPGRRRIPKLTQRPHL